MNRVSGWERLETAPFPVELPLRCMKLFSLVGETVLYPFMGSGSTLVAACAVQPQSDRDRDRSALL